MTYTRRRKYSTSQRQKDKPETIEAASQKVIEAKEFIQETKMFPTVSVYKPKKADSYIRDAPAVKISTPKGEKLVIAPDILCKLSNGDTIWVEVKDKPQRFYYPDTGCDEHQFMGYWAINRYRKEPVLFLFIDPPLSEMDLSGLNPRVKENFIRRCKRFVGKNGEPVFYGHWVSYLTKFDKQTGYPKCFPERSRDIPMNIIYFEVRKMVPFHSVKSMKDFLGTYKQAIVAPDFEVFDVSTGKVVKNP